jgi:hypothetical protein
MNFRFPTKNLGTEANRDGKENVGLIAQKNEINFFAKSLQLFRYEPEAFFQCQDLPSDPSL